MSLVALLSLTACLDSTVETTKVRPGSTTEGGNSNSSGAPVFSFASSQETYSLNVPFALAPAITYSGTGLTFNIIGTLPTGLSLDSSTGAITGIPTSGPGSNIYMILATNTSGSSFETLELLTGPVFSYSASQYDYIVGAAFTAILPTVTYPTSGAILYSVSPALPAGLSLNIFTGEISGTPTAASVDTEFTISATANGETNSITIDFNEAAPPTIAYSASYDYVRSTAFSQSPTLTYTGTNFSVAITAGALPAGLSLNASTGAITGTPTGDGDQIVTIRATNDYGFNDHVVNFAEVGPPIFASNSMSDTFTRTMAFSLDIEATLTFPTAADVSYAISPALPNASCTSLSFNATTGVISGTVLANSTTDSNCARSYTVTATNNDDPLTRTQVLTITLSENGPPRFIYAAGTHTYENGVLFSLSPTVYYTGTLSAPAYTINSGSLPAGLTLNATTGVISGTPTGSVDPTGATHQVEIYLTNTDGTTAYTIDLEEVGPPRISYSTTSFTYYRNDNVNSPNVLVTPTVSFCKGGCSFSSSDLLAGLDVDPGTGEIRIPVPIAGNVGGGFTVDYADAGPLNTGSFSFDLEESCNDTGNVFPGQEYGGGAGTPSDPWLTCTQNHLRDLDNNSAGYFKQMADVDMSGYNLPLVRNSCFTGGYEGNNYIISNLKVYDTLGNPAPLGSAVGMFLCMDDFDYVKNLTLVNFYGYGESGIGSLAGKVSLPAVATAKNRAITDVSVYNSYLKDRIGEYVGGLIGMIECNLAPGAKITLTNNIFHGALEKQLPNGLMSALYNSNSGTNGECVDAINNLAFLENIWGVDSFVNPPPTPAPPSYHYLDANDAVPTYPGNNNQNFLTDLSLPIAAPVPGPVRAGVIALAHDDPNLQNPAYWALFNFIVPGSYRLTTSGSGPGMLVPAHLCDRDAAHIIFDNLSSDPHVPGGARLDCQ